MYMYPLVALCLYLFFQLNKNMILSDKNIKDLNFPSIVIYFYLKGDSIAQWQIHMVKPPFITID